MSQNTNWFDHVKTINADAVNEFNQDLLKILTETTQRVMNINTKLVTNLLETSSQNLNAFAAVKSPEDFKAVQAEITAKATTEFSKTMQEVTNAALENYANISQFSEQAVSKAKKATATK